MVSLYFYSTMQAGKWNFTPLQKLGAVLPGSTSFIQAYLSLFRVNAVTVAYPVVNETLLSYLPQVRG